MHPAIRAALLWLAAATLLAAGCTASTATVTPAATTAAADGTASATPAPAAPISSPSTSTTPSASPVPSRTPATGGGPISTSPPPAGYAQSCAKDVPWGKDVSKPFVCLDAPPSGAHVSRGGRLAVRGYAAGSFEHNVIAALITLVPGRGGAVLVQKPGIYGPVYEAYGSPGGWEIVLTIPADAPSGLARVTGYFGSPRGLPGDERIAAASVDVVID